MRFQRLSFFAAATLMLWLAPAGAQAQLIVRSPCLYPVDSSLYRIDDCRRRDDLDLRARERAAEARDRALERAAEARDRALRLAEDRRTRDYEMRMRTDEQRFAREEAARDRLMRDRERQEELRERALERAREAQVRARESQERARERALEQSRRSYTLGYRPPRSRWP